MNDPDGKGRPKRDSTITAAWIAGLLGIVAIVAGVLLTHALGAGSQPGQSDKPNTSSAGQNTTEGEGSPTPAGSTNADSTASSGNALQTASTSGVTVLTNAAGFTLYWFSLDTATASMCAGSCATYWPPVSGPVTAGVGVTGQLGTITRSDGSTQATYDGHPLYTYAGDSAPGQANGNGLNASGGVWHEVTV
jgi:predicted lipoprotein with Yx(FWY)xxD motif